MWSAATWLWVWVWVFALAGEFAELLVVALPEPGPAFAPKLALAGPAATRFRPCAHRARRGWRPPSGLASPCAHQAHSRSWITHYVDLLTT